jgi:hypothetical protein
VFVLAPPPACSLYATETQLDRLIEKVAAFAEQLTLQLLDSWTHPHKLNGLDGDAVNERTHEAICLQLELEEASPDPELAPLLAKSCTIVH